MSPISNSDLSGVSTAMYLQVHWNPTSWPGKLVYEYDALWISGRNECSVHFCIGNDLQKSRLDTWYSTMVPSAAAFLQ